MTIGVRPADGEAEKIGKLYFGLELRSCPPFMFGIFRPYLMVWLYKVLDAGQPGLLRGRSPKIWGVRWWGAFPFGISVQISRF